MEALIVSISVAALGTWGIRVLRQLDKLHAKVDRNSSKLARIDGRLGNGLADEIRKMTEVDSDVRGLRQSFERFVREDFAPFKVNVEDHIANEETRILEFCQRQRNTGGEGT